MSNKYRFINVCHFSLRIWFLKYFFLPWSKKLPLCPVWCYFSEYCRSCGHIGEVEQKPRYLPLLWPLEGLELLPVIRRGKSEQKKYASLVARMRRADQTYKHQTHISNVIAWIKYTDINLTHTVYVKHAVTTPHIVQQTTFSGSLMPGRYLTFSCSVLTISVSFLPSIISSYMYILTSGLNFSFLSTTFFPRILAIADPLTKKIPFNRIF